MYIGHSNDKGELQPLAEHLLGTAKLSEAFAQSFNHGDYGYICGLIHDLGKYSDEFQNRILGHGHRCDHSSAGAREAIALYGRIKGKLLAYCISGHHSGLLNCGSMADIGGEGTLSARLSDHYQIPDYTDYVTDIPKEVKSELNNPRLLPVKNGGFTVSFFIRMLFSCLVDADFLDTESFMNSGKKNRFTECSFKTLQEQLNRKVKNFNQEGIINEKRNKIFNDCVYHGEKSRGLYSLTVPTGGGKTLATMGFALEHAMKNNMDRIIYVIPYTSIIEQNAKVFKELFGEEYVLEHHANFDFDDDEGHYKKKKLQSENWDAPIIVTTNVQFFESLYASKSSKCRKIHNIANSIIIFDEVQMLPTEYIVPCVYAMDELCRNYQASIVLCSATQPSINHIFPSKKPVVEICSQVDEINRLFRRTSLLIRGKMGMEELVIELNQCEQVLCIVNTRKHAYELFNQLDGENNYHLSTLMYPAHRKATIDKIRKCLNNNQPCKVISTRLIEAGVDLDFPVVYRSLGGLDSIIQAAGRCNREGKLGDRSGKKVLGLVHIFEPDGLYSRRQPASFKREIEVTKQVVEEYEDLLSNDAIYRYFELLYFYLGESLDNKKIVARLDNRDRGRYFDFDFADIAKEFKIIEDISLSIIIPDEKVEKDLERLAHLDYKRKTLRKLQSYVVNIYKKEFEHLLNGGKLRAVDDDIYILRSLEDYDSKSGLIIKEAEGIGIYF